MGFSSGTLQRTFFLERELKSWFMFRFARLQQLWLSAVTVALLLHLFPASAQAAKPDAGTIREMVRKAVANYKGREAQRDDYTYLAHVVRIDSQSSDSRRRLRLLAQVAQDRR